LGRLSSTVTVACAYRISIPHDGCGTLLRSQLLECDTPVLTAHPRGDQSVSHLAVLVGNNSPMSVRSALVVGAGIAGSTLAYWLTRHGIETTVVERAEGQRSSGSPVDVRGPAWPWSSR
jgi:hypothetical protein